MKKVVSYIVEDENCPQFRYRVKNVQTVLETSKEWEIRYYLKSKIDGLDLSDVSLLIIERQTEKDGRISRIIRKAQRLGVKVLMDLDDLVFDYRDLKILMDSVQEKNLLYWVGYFWGIRRIAKKVDGFLCTNEFLADKLKRSFNKPTQVISNSLNREQVEVSDKLIKKNNIKQDGFVIGYFSGSPTHVKDFRLIEAELIRFLNSHEDAKLRVVGDMEFSDEIKRWINGGRVEILRKVDYLKLQELLFEVDVNIAPLVVNDFTNCKSELKYFEAAVVETTTIASPTYAFKNAIEDGKNGFLAGPGEWFDKFEYLYNNPKKNREVAKRAREYALKRYYGKELRKQVEEAYDYFAK